MRSASNITLRHNERIRKIYAEAALKRIDIDINEVCVDAMSYREQMAWAKQEQEWRQAQ